MQDVCWFSHLVIYYRSPGLGKVEMVVSKNLLDGQRNRPAKGRRKKPWWLPNRGLTRSGCPLPTSWAAALDDDTAARLAAGGPPPRTRGTRDRVLVARSVLSWLHSIPGPGKLPARAAKQRRCLGSRRSRGLQDSYSGFSARSPPLFHHWPPSEEEWRPCAGGAAGAGPGGARVSTADGGPSCSTLLFASY